MYKLILFLKRVSVPLLFVLIELFALGYYMRATSFTRARLLVVSNAVAGGMNSSIRSVVDYFGLRKENKVLTDRIVELEARIADYERSDDWQPRQQEEIESYLFTSARVVRNAVFGQNNFFTIDKGLRDDVEANMAVLTPEGYVAGYVVECSERWAVCMSVANRDFTMGGKGAHNEYMGSVEWLGDDYRRVNLSDVPYYANFAVGDTIVSTVSYRFPPDRIIGVVEEFEPTEDKMNSHLRVRLAADLSRLDRVLVVKFVDGQEFFDLQSNY